MRLDQIPQEAVNAGGHAIINCLKKIIHYISAEQEEWPADLEISEVIITGNHNLNILLDNTRRRMSYYA